MCHFRACSSDTAAEEVDLSEKLYIEEADFGLVHPSDTKRQSIRISEEAFLLLRQTSGSFNAPRCSIKSLTVRDKVLVASRHITELPAHQTGTLSHALHVFYSSTRHPFVSMRDTFTSSHRNTQWEDARFAKPNSSRNDERK